MSNVFDSLRESQAFARLRELGSLLDDVVGVFDPMRAVSRRDARQRLGAYEAGKTTRLTNVKRSTESGDGLVDKAGKTLRDRARWLDENHDVAIGILDVLVNNIVGAGISVEPQVKTLNGDLHEDLNDYISELHDDWLEHPDVTWLHDGASMDRMACASWLRDGEALGQMVSGDAKFIDHGTTVPYSIELIEPDLLPHEYNDAGKRIRQGIERNAWGRPTGFWVYRQHPGDMYAFGSQLPSLSDLKRIPAQNMLFLRWSRRISQLRGSSIFASIINRLGDVKMYEDYERVAAQVAAALTVFIARDLNIPAEACPDLPSGGKTPLRQIAPGMVLEGQPGEKPEVIQSNRPSNQLETFRKANLRAAASGVGAGYSSIAKDYAGSYSSQRQELVEQNVTYRVARAYFTTRWKKPQYVRFVQTAELAGLLQKFKGQYDPATLGHALYANAQMPWIDPEKELRALEYELNLDLTSRSAVIRARGGNPRHVAKQIKQDEKTFGPLKTKQAQAANDPAQPEAVGTTTTEQEEK